MPGKFEIYRDNAGEYRFRPRQWREVGGACRKGREGRGFIGVAPHASAPPTGVETAAPRPSHLRSGFDSL